MAAKWRVVSIDKEGKRVTVDEGLSQEKALEIAAAMMTEGHNVNIEAEPPRRLPGILNRHD